MSGASIRAGYRKLAESFRGIPGGWGLHEHSVTLLLETWSGSQPGEGTPTTTEVPLLVGGQNPKVRWVSEKEIALGVAPSGTVEIGPLTPACAIGGVELSTMLATDLAQGGTRYFRITGPRVPGGMRYALARLSADRALHFSFQVVPAGV